MSDVVTVALVGAVPSTIVAAATLVVAIRNGRQGQKIHLLVNSKMSAALQRIEELEAMLKEIR